MNWCVNESVLPRISIVTPSYNQVGFVGSTVESVLAQRYPRLEYIVIDGGSTDGSLEVLQARAREFSHFVSEADSGQYDAINKGFMLATGDVMGWLNSDDMHLPWTLRVVGEIFGLLPEVEWLSTRFPILWRGDGVPERCSQDRDGVDRKLFQRGSHCAGLGGRASSIIQQESTFWRRSLWERCGGKIDSTMDFAADYELWLRFAKEADLYLASVPLAGFRRHGDQKTALHLDRYELEAQGALRRHGGKPMSLWQSSRHMLGKLLHRRLATKLGLLAPIKVIEPGDGFAPWKIVTK